MMTTLSRSQTLAVGPNFSWKMPIVPGPQTSWVMSTSTSHQTFSPGSQVRDTRVSSQDFFSYCHCHGQKLLFRRGCESEWRRGFAGLILRRGIRL